MINQGNNVPKNTIVIFKEETLLGASITDERVLNAVKVPNKKREWFSPRFYHCLPLTIGNQMGFIVTSEYSFEVEWDGGDSVDALKIHTDEPLENFMDYFPAISSHFGHGIFTLNFPFIFRTPPGVNLMTINPPNYIIPNVTVLNGVVEADNLRRNFTFNLKVQMPNIRIRFEAGVPLAAFIPIPRYFADGFDLKFADEVFSLEEINEEIQADTDAYLHRINVEAVLPDQMGKHYFKGTDVYGNKFSDHQKP